MGIAVFFEADDDLALRLAEGLFLGAVGDTVGEVEAAERFADFLGPDLLGFGEVVGDVEGERPWFRVDEVAEDFVVDLFLAADGEVAGEVEGETVRDFSAVSAADIGDCLRFL